MTNPSSIHFGRRWTGHEVEDECPCPKAACGLAIADGQPAGSCEEHNPENPIMAKTMRQWHLEENCPGGTDA